PREASIRRFAYGTCTRHLLLNQPKRPDQRPAKATDTHPIDCAVSGRKHVGLLRSLLGFDRSRLTAPPEPITQRARTTRRGVTRGHIEALEPRQMLAANGIVPQVLLGSVYFEEATGDDSAPDIIEVSYVGGAAGTKLDRIIISGDKGGDGLSAGDVFFDTADGGLGLFKAVGLKIESHDGFEVTGVTV